jgi:LysM repeat protein
MSDEAATKTPIEPEDSFQIPPAGDGPIACPYLVAQSGAWRSSSPTRDHRCTAVAPAAPLAIDKQRRLCLTSGHLTCATYLAALAARRERGSSAGERSPLRWEVARTTPVVDIGVGFGATVAGLVADRRGWQAIPAIGLVVALGAVALSGIGRDQSGPAVGAAGSGTPSPGATASRASAAASPSPSPMPSPSAEEPSATPSVAPSPAPTATPSPVPSAQTTYSVKSGDTLYDIARAYNTTVAAIMQLNGLTSTVLHVGQVLLIP